jgi:hypothetical protein
MSIEDQTLVSCQWTAVILESDRSDDSNLSDPLNVPNAETSGGYFSF